MVLALVPSTQRHTVNAYTATLLHGPGADDQEVEEHGDQPQEE